MNKLLSLAAIAVLSTTSLMASNYNSKHLKATKDSYYIGASYVNEYDKNALELSLIDRASIYYKGKEITAIEGSISVTSEKSFDLNTNFWLSSNNKYLSGLLYKFGLGYESYKIGVDKTVSKTVIIKEDGAPDVEKIVDSTENSEKSISQIYAETGIGFYLTFNTFIEGGYKFGKDSKEVSLKTTTNYDKSKNIVFAIGKTFDDNDSTNVRIGLEYKFN